MSPVERVGLELIDLNHQQSHALTNAFVKVSGDSLSLPFFCFNHLVAHAGPRFFRLLSHSGYQAGDDERSHVENDDGHIIERISNTKRERGGSKVYQAQSRDDGTKD